MLYNKYIVIGALCISGLMQGAAGEEARPLLTKASSSRMRLSDCFSLQSTLVPGPRRFYEPVVVSRVFELGLRERLFDAHASTRTTKIIRGACGLVEGNDAELTKAAATLIATSLSTWSLEEFIGNEEAEINMYHAHYIKRIINGDITQLKKLLNTDCKLIIFQSTNDKPEPQKIKTSSQETFDDIIISSKTGLRASEIASYFSDGGTSLQEKLGVLAKYAATLSLSHEASFLKLDRERYAEFLKQELDGKTN